MKDTCFEEGPEEWRDWMELAAWLALALGMAITLGVLAREAAYDRDQD